MTEQHEETEATEQGREIVNHEPRPSEREPRKLAEFRAGGSLNAMVPQTPEEYARMAGLLISAGCVPASYGAATPEETRAKLIIGLMKSVEIGVPPITGLNGIMIVNNRPSVWGDLAMSLVHRSRQLENLSVREIGEKPEPGLPLDKWDGSYGYSVAMWRRGVETAFHSDFTVADAKRANLWMNTRKQPWINYPKDMLFNRARARTLNRGFADALHGLGIVEEERDIEPVEPVAGKIASLLSDEPEALDDEAGEE